MKRKNAFTLIELLAVIVILAIIALIATPIILGIVEDAKRDAFLRSVEMVVSTTDLDINTKPYSTTYTYTITDGDISNLNIPIKNTKGMNGSVKYDNKGNTAYAVNNGKYCVVKEYDGQAIIKDYDETCEYMDYPDDSCFIIAEIPNLKITDVNTCKISVINSMGVDNETATSACNDEPSYLFGDLSLTKYIEYMVDGAPEDRMVQIMSMFGVSRVSNENPEGKITDYTCTDAKIIIGEKINGFKIVAIGENAFEDKKIAKVKIPSSVTSIGSSAFANNQLTSVVIPPSVTSIGESAFNNNQLPDEESFIYQRNSDGSINNTILVSYGGVKRDNVVIPDTIISIEDYAFYNNQLTSIEIPNSVTRIGWKAFRNNRLTSITIPNSVTSIGWEAFSNNQLTSVEISSSVTSIEGGAFNNNQLPDEQAFIYDRKSDGSIDNTKIVSYGGKKRENVVIPDTVTIIGNYTFEDNQLISVTIPSSVTDISYRAFDNNQLTSVELPSSIKQIGESAFRDNQLTSVEIPSSVTSIGAMAFQNNQLTSVTIPNSVTSIAGYAFENNQLTSVEIPSSVEYIYNGIFKSNQLTNVIIKGKSSTSDFTYYGSSVFGWAEGYSDANITFVNE